MKKLFNHNQSPFKEKYLVFFAGQSNGGPIEREKDLDRETRCARMLQYAEEEKKQAKTEEAKKAKPVAQSLVEKYRDGKISGKVLDATDDILQDPDKRSDDNYKEFLKAIAEGRFPDNGEIALNYLTYLDGTEEERKEVGRFLRKKDGTISKRLLKAKLQDLEESRQSQLEQSQTNDVKSAVNTIIPNLEISSAKDKIANATKIDTKNWHPESAPAGVMEALDAFDIKKGELWTKANSLDQERASLVNQANGESSAAEIEAIKNKLEAIDLQVDGMGEEGERLRNEAVKYLQRSLAQFRAIRSFSKRAGLDINNITKLTTWFFAAKNSGNKASELGLVVDEQTGHAVKRHGVMQIKGIRFTNEINDTTIEVDSIESGSLVVDYISENGTPLTTGARDFLNMINGLDAYTEIDSLEELNAQIQIEAGFESVQVGQTYSTEVLVDIENNVYETREFTIEKIENGQIFLDRVVVTTPRQKVPRYCDYKSSTLSFGKFAKFVRQNGYSRNLETSEISQVAQKVYQSQFDEIDSFMEGSTEKSKERIKAINAAAKSKSSAPVIPVTPGAQEQCRMKNNMGRWSDSTIEAYTGSDGKMRWKIKEKRNVGAVGPIFAPRIPDNEAHPSMQIPGSRKKSRYHEGNPRIVEHDLSERQLMKMVDGNELEGAGTIAEPAPEEMAKLDAQNASAENDLMQEGSAEDDSSGVILQRQTYDEALAYDTVHKVGGMTTVERGMLSTLWSNTRFMTVDDLWELGKAGYEYYVRRWERRQKSKYSDVAKDIPFWSPEMQRINQASENEQVNQFKEALDQMSILDIQELLNTTDNQDMMKACLVTLCEKGQMRWDDIDFWRNLNGFTNSAYNIPIPTNGDPATIVSEKDQRRGTEFIQAAVDSLWGEGTYNDWFQQNKSKYASDTKSYYEEGKELEGLDGGHGRKLGQLLKKHKEGGYVDPHEYEGLIMHAIEFGKSSMHAKVYYMIEGVAAENQHGRTILSFERMAHINSELLVKFPLLEYLCARATRTNGKQARWTIDDYKSWVKSWDNGDPSNPENCSPGKSMDDFLWRYILPSDDTQNRINKAIRNGENLDHDDMFGYLPPATENILTDSCKSMGGGSKKFLTVEGYANGAPGFSQYMRSLAENGNVAKLMEAIKSYVRFEGIMMERFEKGDNGYQRFDDATLNSGTICSPTIPPKTYFAECNRAVERVIYHYNDEELTRVWETLRQETGDIAEADERKKQGKINFAFKRFGKEFARVVKKDGGAAMTTIIDGSNLTGMPYTSDEEKDRQKHLKEKSHGTI